MRNVFQNTDGIEKRTVAQLKAASHLVVQPLSTSASFDDESYSKIGVVRIPPDQAVTRDAKTIPRNVYLKEEPIGTASLPFLIANRPMARAWLEKRWKDKTDLYINRIGMAEMAPTCLIERAVPLKPGKIPSLTSGKPSRVASSRVAIRQ